MFETDRIPSGWPVRLNAMDEIWVPTKFHKQVFADWGTDPKKLFVIPESVDITFYKPTHKNKYHLKNVKKRAFTFLSVFK